MDGRWRRDDAGTAIPDNSKLAHCGGPGSSCDNQRIEFDSLGPIDPQNHENALLPGDCECPELELNSSLECIVGQCVCEGSLRLLATGRWEPLDDNCFCGGFG